MGTYRISQLAEKSGVPATTLRYYEKEGLLPAARTPGGYRSYTDADVDRIQFISVAKHLGLPLDQIRELLGVWNGGMCREIRDELRRSVAAQIAAADQRVVDLHAFRNRLAAALAELRDLPAKNGPCDPACAFLHDLPDRVPQPVLGPRPVPRPSPGTDCAAVACSLEGGQYEERIRRWRHLLADAPRTPARGGGITVRLPASHAAALADLAVAEQQCCRFFSFQLTFSGAYVELSAHAPDMAEPLVEVLFGVAARNPQEPQRQERQKQC